MKNLVLKDKRITNFIPQAKIKKLLAINKYLGNASKQAKRVIEEIKKNIIDFASNLPLTQEAAALLKEFSVPYDLTIALAKRSSSERTFQ